MPNWNQRGWEKNKWGIPREGVQCYVSSTESSKALNACIKKSRGEHQVIIRHPGSSIPKYGDSYNNETMAKGALEEVIKDCPGPKYKRKEGLVDMDGNTCWI